MVFVESTSAAEIAQRLVDLLRGESVAVELRFRQNRGVTELWLITEPTSPATEQRLYETSRTLYRVFPKAIIDFHVVNPALFSRFDPERIIPAGTMRLSVR